MRPAAGAVPIGSCLCMPGSLRAQNCDSMTAQLHCKLQVISFKAQGRNISCQVRMLTCHNSLQTCLDMAFPSFPAKFEVQLWPEVFGEVLPFKFNKYMLATAGGTGLDTCRLGCRDILVRTAMESGVL